MEAIHVGIDGKQYVELASLRDKPSFKSSSYWGDGNAHLNGILGEVAYAKHYNVPYDISVTPTGDGGADLCILGRTVDVKAATYNPPILKICSMGEWTADLLALAYIENMDNIWLYGFADRNTFKEHSYVRNFGWGDRLCLDHQWLWF